MRPLRLLALASLVPLLFAPGPAAADPSFSAQNLKPATDNGYYLGVFGSHPLPRGEFNLGLAFDFAEEPVILVNAAGDKLQDITHREIAAHLYGTYGLFPWFDAGLLVSAIPYKRFQAVGSATADNQFKMGDIQLNLRVRALDNHRYPIGIAVIPYATFPTGDDATLSGNGGFTGGGLLVLDTKRIRDRFSASLNVGAEIREQAALTSGTTMDDRLLYGAAMNLAVHPDVELIAELRGFTLLSDLFDSRQRPIEIDGGVRFYPHKNIAGTVGGGVGVLDGVGNPLYRLLASVSYIPEHKGFERVRDTDGDGVTDDKDRCPTEPGPKENDGCPKEPTLVITPEEFRILTRPIHFDFGRATLRPDALPILATLADALKAKPSIRRISIEGHCDFIGTDAFNNWLSQERARTVQKYLVGQGIEEVRLDIVGHGEKMPVDPARTSAARAKNRRVEFLFKEVEGMILPEPIPPSAEPTLPETNPAENPDLTTPNRPLTPEETQPAEESAPAAPEGSDDSGTNPENSQTEGE